jgi:hypothetical protein
LRKEKKMKKYKLMLTFCAVLTSFATTSNATPIQWSSAQGGNDHCYEAFTTLLTWYDAETIAEASVFLGCHGYLATITSQGETNFVSSNFPAYCWLGGFQPPGSPEPDGGWQWVTDESWGPYTNWAGGEPSNSDGEDGLIIWPSGIWNDGHRESLCGGYIVEYPVPEPTTLFLLGLGGLTLLRKRRK